VTNFCSSNGFCSHFHNFVSIGAFSYFIDQPPKMLRKIPFSAPKWNLFFRKLFLDSLRSNHLLKLVDKIPNNFISIVLLPIQLEPQGKTRLNTFLGKHQEMFNCQNPNSTNDSIELSLRLDYIFTQRSTTTNSLLLLLTGTGQASQAGRLYNYTVTHRPVQPLCTTSLDFVFTWQYHSDFQAAQIYRSGRFRVWRLCFSVSQSVSDAI
jgi:hypothetical protein